MDYHILIITIIMILLDILCGCAGAVSKKDLQSEKLRKGLWHKCGFIGLIALAYVLEYAAQYVDLGFEIPAVAAVCVYIIATEAVSIGENLCVLNPDLANSPFGSIFKHDEKIQEAIRISMEERTEEAHEAQVDAEKQARRNESTTE